MAYTIAVVVNKDEGELAFSETFLHAHINGLPCRTVVLIGNPGMRRIDGNSNNYLVSRTFVPLAFRWFQRHLGLQTLHSQDTKALAAFFRANKVDAVLAEYGVTAVSVMDACRQLGIPLIAHYHGYDAYRRWVINTYADQYRTMFQSAAAIIGVSRHMCSTLVALGAPPEKVFHNACGADLPPADSVRESRVQNRFLMVGRLVEKKAPFVAILAFSQVAKALPDAELEIIGDGPLSHACQLLVLALGLNDRVHFRGARPHADVFAAMARASCFLQHSVQAPDGDREGTPVGVLEAMGMGLPVVSTRHGGIADVIDHGVTGYLVDEYDIEGTAEAMLGCAKHPERAREVGLAARAAVAENWTHEKSAERLWQVIEGAIEGKLRLANFVPANY